MTTLIDAVKAKHGGQLYAQDKLLVDVTEEILYEMTRLGVSKADLASKLGKSKPYVTRLLNGDHNMTLKTLSDVCYVLGLAPRIVIDGDTHEKELNLWQEAHATAEFIWDMASDLSVRVNILEQEQKQMLGGSFTTTWTDGFHISANDTSEGNREGNAA